MPRLNQIQRWVLLEYLGLRLRLVLATLWVCPWAWPQQSKSASMQEDLDRLWKEPLPPRRLLHHCCRPHRCSQPRLLRWRTLHLQSKQRLRHLLQLLLTSLLSCC